MLISIVVGASVALGLLVASLVRRWPAADPAGTASVRLGEKIRRHRRLARFLRLRLDPSTAAGLALTAALAVAVIAGAAVGLLIYLLRTYPRLAAADLSVARWAAAHATRTSTPFLKDVTLLGSTIVVIVLGTFVALATSLRARTPMPIPFMIAALGGESLIVFLIKVLVGRARPTISVLAGYHGQSFPSGHSAAAAACYGAVTMLVARRWSRGARSAAYGAAAGIAVAVACSRVFLGVHWVSDVVAGLAVGWGWLAVCAIAFGGRLLTLGAPAVVAELPPTPAAGIRATASRSDQ